MKTTNEDERYTGENEKLIEINKRIVIRREDGVPYLIRRSFLTLGKWFSIKYHQILESDPKCTHDHPWPFLTIILKGGYYETTPVTQKDSGRWVKRATGVDGREQVVKYHRPGSIMYRPASWEHSLQLKRNLDGTNIPAHTLVFTGKVIRDWGFFTKDGWMFWRKYNPLQDCN